MTFLCLEDSSESNRECLDQNLVHHDASLHQALDREGGGSSFLQLVPLPSASQVCKRNIPSVHSCGHGERLGWEGAGVQGSLRIIVGHPEVLEPKGGGGELLVICADQDNNVSDFVRPTNVYKVIIP